MKFLNLLLNEGKHIKYWINLQKGGGLFVTNPFLCEKGTFFYQSFPMWKRDIFLPILSYVKKEHFFVPILSYVKYNV
jgi:hypothetical protein